MITPAEHVAGVTYTISVPYEPGSLTVYVNGLAQPVACWTEGSSVLGTFVLTETPVAGDTIAATYTHAEG